MKRIISILLCLVLILAFAGCKDNDEILLSSEASSIVEDTVSDSSDVLPSTPSQQETPSSNITSSNNESTSTPVNSSSSNESTSTPVNSSSNDTTTTTPSKPQQTVVDDPNTITAPNGDKIKIDLTSGENPSVLVKVNGKEIYSYNNFIKHKDMYDFEKDFTDEVIAEYSDDEILWAYRFNWGVIHSAKYTTSTTETEATISYACSKHEYEKCCYKNIGHYKIAEVWNLIDFEVIEQTGTKIFWDPYVAAQMIFEYYYKTENYTLKQIDDLEKAGYSFSDKKYYEMHNKELTGINRYKKIYEVSVDGKPFALLYSDSAGNYFMLQELDWSTAGDTGCRFTENGVEYHLYKSESDKLTELS